MTVLKPFVSRLFQLWGSHIHQNQWGISIFVWSCLVRTCKNVPTDIGVLDLNKSFHKGHLVIQVLLFLMLFWGLRKTQALKQTKVLILSSGLWADSRPCDSHWHILMLVHSDTHTLGYWFKQILADIFGNFSYWLKRFRASSMFCTHVPMNTLIFSFTV